MSEPGGRASSEGEEVPSPPTPAVTTDLAELTSGPTVAPDGRWILTLPDYGAPWPAGAVAGPDGWRQQLASDPRTRGVAGLGAWAGIEWQDRIADAAATQAAALAIASQRIRHLTFGLSATRSLWRNRFLPLGSGIMQLWCLGPSMRRLPAGNSSVLDAVDGRTPLLVRELFSTSLRRVMRRGSALANLAAPDATAPAAVLDAANRCPGPRRPPRLRDELDHPPHEPGELALSDQDRAALLALARPLPRQPPPCRPVDLDLLGSRVAAAVDPTGPRPLVVDRVLGTITGLVEPVLAPPEIEPELDIPMWKFLDDYQRDWLLPGVGLLPRDAVTAVQSNPAFVDAFLVGANVQTVGELRWRNIPITTGWTPLRRFWLRIGGPPPGGPATDITGVKFWAETSGLGDASHLPDPGAGANLVVVFRTDLFRRYPTTLVYLAQINPPDDWVNLPPVDDPDFHRVNPTFTGAIGADVVFFGFPVEPAQGRDHWVVLEEPPHGPRFNANPPTSVPDNGAGYAHTAFAKPVRVFLGKVM